MLRGGALAEILGNQIAVVKLIRSATMIMYILYVLSPNESRFRLQFCILKLHDSPAMKVTNHDILRGVIISMIFLE